MAHGPDQHAAAGSALGFLYQCRYALLASLHRLKTGQSFEVSLETLDDVTFESGSAASELIQTKHHLHQSASLSNASPDLWKTLRIWSERVAAGLLSDSALFILVTTATAPPDSAAAKLRPRDRDTTGALQSLRTVASRSQSRSNRAAYAAFTQLAPSAQEDLLTRIFIIDAEPQVADLDSAFFEVTFAAVRKPFFEAFLRRLEGWWFDRVIQQLSDETHAPILSEELDEELHELSQQFHDENLPIDDDLLEIEFDPDAHWSSLFVQQLELIGVNPRRIILAIKDYLRAAEQRSRWVRDDLLVVGELKRYENRLIEEWEHAFEEMNDTLDASTTEEHKRDAARTLFNELNRLDLPIRRWVTRPFITRGTFHILADEQSVGWHPDFASRLHELLNPAGSP